MSNMTVELAFIKLEKDLTSWSPAERTRFVERILEEHTHECPGCHKTLIPLTASLCADCRSFQADVHERYHS